MKNGTTEKEPWERAEVSCLIKFLHPSELIRKAYPNPLNQQWLENCITLRQDVKKIKQKEQLSLVVTHHDFKYDDGELLELYAVKRHFKVENEGDPDYFFDGVAKDDNEQTKEEVLPQVIDDELMGVNDGGPQNLAAALNGVVDSDDDNEPAPENVPTPGVSTTTVPSPECGHEGICYQCQPSNPNSKAKLADLVDVTRNNIYVQLFERLFPYSSSKM